MKNTMAAAVQADHQPRAEFHRAGQLRRRPLRRGQAPAAAAGND